MNCFSTNIAPDRGMIAIGNYLSAVGGSGCAGIIMVIMIAVVVGKVRAHVCVGCNQ
jgi:hypothetical protein